MLAIRPILERPKPYNLQTLRLINCKIQTQHTRDLIKLIRETNNIRTLGLVNCKITDEAMSELGMVLQESKSMQELDISWNVLKMQSYLNLIIGLGSNKTLVSLNLSWNTIFDGKETVIKVEEPPPSDLDTVFESSKKPIQWYE